MSTNDQRDKRVSPAPQPPRLTRSGARRQGDEYQDVQALDLLVKWLEHTDRFQWVQLEADDSGFLDDIHVMRADGVLEVWQVKFSTGSHRADDAWTWKILLKQERGKKESLLQKWFTTWQNFVSKGERISPILVSNRRAASELALDTPGEGKVQWHKITEQARKKISKQLGGEPQAQAFFEAFRFRLEEPSLHELEAGAKLRFERLGGTSGGWHALTKAVRGWVNIKDVPPPNGQISLEEVRRIAKLKAHAAQLRTFLPRISFFQHYLEPHRLFHHRLPQVGRGVQLNDLLSFVAGKNQISVLPGRGGSGKSKLLFTLSRHLARRCPDLSVRLVAENLPIKETALDELPDDSCLVIVDDAHRADGIDVLLAAARQNPALKVLLVTRPHATEYLTAQARYAGFDRNEILINKPLPDLDYAREHRRLARLALGRDWVHYSDKLASVTRGCPLLTVLGGQLLRTKQVAPSFLVQNNTFRQEVLSRFRDIQFGEIISQIGRGFTPQLCADVLPLVAAMTPFDLENTKVLEAVAQLSGTDEIKLKQLLTALVEAGALVRGGKFVRIVPDVLSDFILHEACFTRDGTPTGWADKVYQMVADFSLDLILHNLAELDWRIRTTPLPEDQSSEVLTSSEGGLLNTIWRDIETRFRAGSLAERKNWLGRLQRISFMQPSRLWPLIDIACNEPVSEDPNEVSHLLRPWQHPTTQADVLNALSPVLRGVACDDRFTERCANLLWEIGRDVETKAGSSSSAMEALRQIASYERYKPLAFNLIVLECCREWMDDPNIHTYRHSVLQVLTPMLARQVQWTDMDGHWLSSGSFTLPPEPFRELRRGAMQLVERCALSGVRRVVLEALHTLHVPISEQGLWEIKEEEPSEWQAWEEEQLAAVEIIARVAQNNDDPFVRLRIWEELHWQAERGPRPAVQGRAREILEALPHSFESRFILLMTLRYGLEHYRRTWEAPEESDDEWLKSDEAKRILIYQKRYQRDEEFARQVTQEWVERHPDPREGFNAFDEWIIRIETSRWWKGDWTRNNSFLLKLAADFPSYAKAWCEIALENPEARATEKCDDLLCELRRQDSLATLELTQRFLAHGHPNLWLRVASSYSWRGWPSDPLPEEWEIVRDLLAFPYPQVKRNAAKIVSAIASTHGRVALELVLETDVGEDSELAEELFKIFEERRKFNFNEITSDELAGLLNKLKAIESIKSYHLGRFLLQAALRDPAAVAQLLLGRVQHKIKLNEMRLNMSGNKDRFTTKLLVDAFAGLPQSGFHDAKFQGVASHPYYPNALRLIRDAALSNEYRSALLWEDTLSELFRDFSLNYCSVSLDILEEWTNSGDCVRVRAAINLLGNTYLGFYLQNLPFVSNYLRRAKECGKAILEEVERSMLHYAEYGPPGAMASHRGERSNRLFHGALEALEKVKGDPLTSRFFIQLRDRGQKMIQSEMQKKAEEEVYFRS